MPTPYERGARPPAVLRATTGSLRHRIGRTRAVLAALATLLAVSSVLPAQARTHEVPDASVVTEWNAIASRTVFEENGTPVPASPLYFAYVSLAVYDAVVAVEGRYEAYTPVRRSPSARRASSEVAAATAAFQVLSHHFPASRENLGADYATFMAEHPRGAATTLGTQVGAQAAARIIDQRRDDGRGAAVTLAVTPEPGVWRPTPPAGAPMAVPWLGFVTPFLLDSPDQVQLPGPDAITSPEYAADLAEVRAFGSQEPSSRSAEQTATALFMNANPVAQYRAAVRGAVTAHDLDVVDAARAFAMLDASTADALIVAWRAKYDTPYWRPVTAVRLADTDGNDATTADPAWTPLVSTPPYPEYPSGHASVTGATTGTLAHLFGTDVDVTVPSLTAAPARTYTTTEQLDQDATDGRVWLGFHFRRAMTDGNDLGHEVAALAATHHFRPLDR